jgi:hypothetical protein
MLADGENGLLGEPKVALRGVVGGDSMMETELDVVRECVEKGSCCCSGSRFSKVKSGRGGGSCRASPGGGIKVDGKELGGRARGTDTQPW